MLLRLASRWALSKSPLFSANYLGVRAYPVVHHRVIPEIGGGASASVKRAHLGGRNGSRIWTAEVAETVVEKVTDFGRFCTARPQQLYAPR